MAGWTVDDPELIATFRAEVEERLASLQAGLLALEGNRSPRQAIIGLFRDAHTVKGSARMLGLDGVLQLAHTAEDLLGALRDGRFPVRRDLIDLLLASGDAIGRAIPGAAAPLDDAALAPLIEVMKLALDGREGLVAPDLGAAAEEPGSGADGNPGAADREPDAAPPEQRAPDSVRVSAAKVYGLLDVVGEAELGARRVERATASLVSLAAEQGRWIKTLRDLLARDDVADSQLALHRLALGADDVGRCARDLREQVELHGGQLARVRDDAMALAMVPVRRVFAALPRILRDVAGNTGKDVALELSGEDVELDKQVLDGIADALKHLVINAVDHGCETPEQRRARGKTGKARVRVAARSAGGTVVISVADDGNGINEDAVRRKAIEVGLLPADSTLSGDPLLHLLFLPAFSTAGRVTETSGRGVGLDVVRSAVEELGGSVHIATAPGAGTTFELVLPVTLGVLRCLLARLGEEVYAIPVPSVVESVSLRDADLHEVAGSPVVVRHGQPIPLVDLGAALGVAGERAARSALIARHGERSLAWAVDRLEGELELVVKDLGGFLGRVPLITGATIDGDGSVVCLLDLREVAEAMAGGAAAARASSAVAVGAGPGRRAAGVKRARILIAEDSVGVRELERVILENAGYHVETAVDGLDAAGRLSADAADLVVTDVEMPGMDGFSLTRMIRRTRGWEQVPVVVMTSCGDEADQRAGLDAGANAYLLKQEFDQTSLLETVRRLIGR